MAYRFTKSDKWQDPWFRRLKPIAKLLFLYICDNCDWGGFWEIDLPWAALSIGCNEELIYGAFEEIKPHLVVREAYCWLPKFIKHQRNIKEGGVTFKAAMKCLESRPEFRDVIEKELNKNQEKTLFSQWEPTGSPVDSKGIGKGKGISKSKKQSPSKIVDKKFEQFWKAYPKKVGKGAARKSFEKIKPSDELLQKILSAVEQQSKSEQWLKEGGRYIPNPSTWLNQERWDDELVMKDTHYGTDNTQRNNQPFIR